MTRLRIAPWLLAAATWAALAIPVDARATLYELSWQYKYGRGDIVFDGSALDSNPDPARQDYLDAIVSYDLGAYTAPMKDVLALSGHSGEISVKNPGPEMPPECESASFCPGATLTFWLDSIASTADPAGFHLVLIAPWSLGNFFDHLPLPSAPCAPDPDSNNCTHPFNGEIVPNTPNGVEYIPIVTAGAGPDALLQPLQAVTEPATVALFGFGLAALAMTTARRAHTTTGSGSSRMPKRP